jgi:hypothetical protein
MRVVIPQTIPTLQSQEHPSRKVVTQTLSNLSRNNTVLLSLALLQISGDWSLIAVNQRSL